MSGTRHTFYRVTVYTKIAGLSVPMTELSFLTRCAAYAFVDKMIAEAPERFANIEAVRA